MRLSTPTILFLAMAPVAVAARPVDAQIQASEHAVVAQTIDGTTITLEYSRPVARGRALFGELVPWGVVWTPGANWATILDTDSDIRLNGVEVPAGRYSVWAIPRPDRFTITLNPEDSIFHFVKPDSTAEQIHVSAETEEGPHAEMLTWSFPMVRGDGAVLRFQWGTTVVPLDVIVPPSQPLAMDAEARALYVGSYEMKFMEGIGWPATGTLEVFEEDGALRGRLPFPIHPNDELEFDLVPAGGGRFNPGLYRGDQLFTIEMGANFDFDVGPDRATAVRILGPQGTVFAQGERSG